MGIIQDDIPPGALAAAEALIDGPLTPLALLSGGQHATTFTVWDGSRVVVVREFPPGDPAVARETVVLTHIDGLGGLAPRLIAASDSASEHDAPMIITTALPGGPPSPTLAPESIAREMATALAAIHALDPSGLRPYDGEPPAGSTEVAARSRSEWAGLDHADLVVAHTDFWCGNALWDGARLTGVVDWSGACRGPRGLDIAWCRQDLVLLGAPEAAETFLQEYERITGRTVTDVRGWDVHAAARAVDRVETWEPNYLGIGWTEVTASVLRSRLDAFIATL